LRWSAEPARSMAGGRQAKHTFLACVIGGRYVRRSAPPELLFDGRYPVGRFHCCFTARSSPTTAETWVSGWGWTTRPTGARSRSLMSTVPITVDPDRLPRRGSRSRFPTRTLPRRSDDDVRPIATHTRPARSWVTLRCDVDAYGVRENVLHFGIRLADAR